MNQERPCRFRRRLKYNSGSVLIFWYMMDEHMEFWCHPEIVCLHSFHEFFLEYVYIWNLVKGSLRDRFATIRSRKGVEGRAKYEEGRRLIAGRTQAVPP